MLDKPDALTATQTVTVFCLTAVTVIDGAESPFNFVRPSSPVPQGPTDTYSQLTACVQAGAYLVVVWVQGFGDEPISRCNSELTADAHVLTPSGVGSSRVLCARRGVGVPVPAGRIRSDCASLQLRRSSWRRGSATETVRAGHQVGSLRLLLFSPFPSEGLSCS